MFLKPSAHTGQYSALFRQIFASLLALVLFSAALPAFSQNLSPPAPNAEAEELNHALAGLNARYQRASSAEQVQLQSEMLSVAAKRQQLLASLIEVNPGEVLRLALPEPQRAGMPAEVQEVLEQQRELEGELKVLYVDYKDPSQSHPLYLLETAVGKRFSLHFAAHSPGVLSGTRVRVHGVTLYGAMTRDAGETEGAMVLEDGTTSVETLEAGGTSSTTSSSVTMAAALPNTFGDQKTLVILVNFQDQPTVQPWTLEQVRSLVFGTVSDFFKENSYGQTWLSGEVYGWYTVALDSTVWNLDWIAAKANSAAIAAGVDLAPYTRFLYVFPRNSGSSLYGAGTVGGNPSRAWFNGRIDLWLVGHEMGHNFGLQHSNSLECGTTTLGSNCQTYEYGDHFDIMGNERAAHLNAFQKAQLGWLGYGSSPSITTVETDGAYSLEPYELGTAGPKALKILKGIDAVTGAKSWYHVEYRQALGFDSFLTGNTNVLNGVVIHTGSDSDRKSSLILDTTPQSATYGWYDWEDPALGEGLSLSDPDTGVTITTAWTDGGGASVTVDLGAQACVHANPTVSLSPSESQWVAPGTPVSYTVTVTNNDNSACSPVLFALSASVPSSWTAAFAAPTLSLDSGSSASTTLTVTSPTTATGGFYAVGVTATNSANTIYSAATSATYVVVSALDVTVSTNKTSYTRNQSVSITARVSSGASPVANASITFTVTKPNGAVVKQTATTDASGAGIFTLRLKQQDPVGTYQVRVDATSNTLSGNATASFTVQ